VIVAAHQAHAVVIGSPGKGGIGAEERLFPQGRVVRAVIEAIR
jgi:hypothetical protein